MTWMLIQDRRVQAILHQDLSRRLTVSAEDCEVVVETLDDVMILVESTPEVDVDLMPIELETEIDC